MLLSISQVVYMPPIQVKKKTEMEQKSLDEHSFHFFRSVELNSNGPATFSSTTVPFFLLSFWLAWRRYVSVTQCLLSVRWQNATCLIRIKIPVPYAISVDRRVFAKRASRLRRIKDPIERDPLLWATNEDAAVLNDWWAPVSVCICHTT